MMHLELNDRTTDRTNMGWNYGQIWHEILDKYEMKFWTNVRWKADKYKMEVQCEDWSPVAVSSGGRGRHTKLKPTPSFAAFCCFSIYHHFFTPQPVGDRGGRMLLLFRCGNISNGCCTGNTWLLIWPLAKSTWYFGKVNAKAQLCALNLTPTYLKLCNFFRSTQSRLQAGSLQSPWVQCQSEWCLGTAPI